MGDEIIDLQDAAVNFVNANGGKILVVGAVGIIPAEPDRKMNFYVCVKCTGKPPFGKPDEPAPTSAPEKREGRSDGGG